MKKTTRMETTKLIKGSFSPIDAKEILLNMVDSKINFHKIKSLSSLVRWNHPSQQSEQRINELKEAKEQILALIEKAEKEGCTLRIDSTINLSLETKGQAEEEEEICSKAENY